MLPAETSKSQGIAHAQCGVEHSQRQPLLAETEIASLPGVRMILGLVSKKIFEIIFAIHLLEDEPHELRQTRMPVEIWIIKLREWREAH